MIHRVDFSGILFAMDDIISIVELGNSATKFLNEGAIVIRSEKPGYKGGSNQLAGYSTHEPMLAF